METQTLFMQIVLNGLTLGSLYCLVAVGLTLVFGVMGIVNFAHGELYMLGAYAVWWFYGKGHLPFFPAVLLAGLILGVFGIVLERAIFRPLRANPTMGLIASLGVMFILQVLILLAFGTAFKTTKFAYPQIINILGASIHMQRIIIILCGATFLVLLGVFLQRTKQGLSIFACAEDSEAAALQGMSLNTSSAITMFLSAGLAGLAGGLNAPLTPNIDPWMGSQVILKAFIIVIVGGAGSIRGALVISFLLGFVESTLSTLGEPMLTVLVALLIVLAVLSFKPEGMFGSQQ